MSVEIERKFLVDNIPRNLGEYVSIESDQGYLSVLLFKWGYYPACPVFPSSEKDFFMKARNIELNFELNKENEQIVECMSVKYAGITFKYKKI